jgi:Fur family ferric uptake transcriptional regulator
MTRAPAVPRLRFDDLEDALSEMRRRGLRVSASRRLVMAALFAAEGPCSAEHLARGLELDLASVYRNLDTVEQLGLVQHVHLGHGPGLYTLVGAGEHEYLFCEHCGAVRTVAPEQLDAIRRALVESFGYVAKFTHHAIVGSCAACSATKSPGAQATTSGPPRRQKGGPDPAGSSRAHRHSSREHQRGDHDHHQVGGDYVHSHPAPPSAAQ